MNLTNPFGREVSKIGGVATPNGCYCSSGAYSMKYSVGSCYLCGCQCDNGPTNRSANNRIANAKGAK